MTLSLLRTILRLDRNSSQKRKGGSVRVYVKSNITCKIRQHRNPVEPNLKYMWMMWIYCELVNQKYLTASVYHPPKPIYSSDVLIHELGNDSDAMAGIPTMTQ